MHPHGSRRKLAVHGPVIDLECGVPELEPAIDALLGCFSVPTVPEGFSPVAGTIHDYDHAEVSRYLSPTARHLARIDDLLDVYEEGERFWLADDRWGMAELNLLRGHWRSWILPIPKLDAQAVAEYAILWPMAQLIRGRGIHLLPAVSAVRDGFAVLMICPFSLEPELRTMITAGYRIIGQRWTAVREEDGRLALLHVPGRVARALSPQLRGTPSGDGRASQAEWTDLCGEHVGAWQNHAFCDAVLIAGAGRRPKAHLHELDASDAVQRLRAAWPMVELHPTRRQSQLPGRLVQSCRTAELQLSRNPKDLLALLNSLRYAPPEHGSGHSIAA
jgi:hypothetical protein